mgnify:CR=1 FL=1
MKISFIPNWKSYIWEAKDPRHTLQKTTSLPSVGIFAFRRGRRQKTHGHKLQVSEKNQHTPSVPEYKVHQFSCKSNLCMFDQDYRIKYQHLQYKINKTWKYFFVMDLMMPIWYCRYWYIFCKNMVKDAHIWLLEKQIHFIF